MNLFILLLTYLIYQTQILNVSCKEKAESEATNRIFNGTTTEQEYFPWHAAIAVEQEVGVKLCGGSLISNQWLLTAAQCIDGAKSYSIGVGKNNLDSYETSELIVSEFGVKHELYDNITKAHNIGLIKLPRPIFFSERINRTTLANQKTNISSKDDVFISGYGRNEKDEDISVQQTYIQLETITNERCRDYYGDIVLPMVICARPIVQDQGVCNNDFGGALVQTSSNKSTQIGIFSFYHTEGCNKGSPFVFTRISFYINWINNKTGLNFDDGNNSTTPRTNIILYFCTILINIIITNINNNY